MFKKYIGLQLAGILLLILAIGAAGIAIWRSGVGSTNVSISKTKLSEIKDMMKLCSMEIRDDVAIKDSINGKWIFAKNTINGFIRFDLENLDYQQRNDSIFIILPPEEIEVYESDTEKAYEVIDTWNSSPFDMRKLTADEENAIKQRIAVNYKSSFYEKGYVSRARASTRATLSRLLSLMDDKITVIDPHPEGYGSKR